MTHDAIRRRYNALGTKFVTRGTLTREEHVELTYLFYLLTPMLAIRLRDTPERYGTSRGVSDVSGHMCQVGVA